MLNNIWGIEISQVKNFHSVVKKKSTGRHPSDLEERWAGRDPAACPAPAARGRSMQRSSAVLRICRKNYKILYIL